MALNINQNAVFQNGYVIDKTYTIQNSRGITVMCNSTGECVVSTLDGNNNVLSTLDLAINESIEIVADAGCLLQTIQVFVSNGNIKIVSLGGSITES